MQELIYHRQLLPAVETHADKIGFVDDRYQGSYADHADRVFRLSRALADELGVGRGDRFAVMATNSHVFEKAQGGAMGHNIGEPAPDFTLTEFADGRSVSLKDYLGKGGRR